VSEQPVVITVDEDIGSFFIRTERDRESAFLQCGKVPIRKDEVFEWKVEIPGNLFKVVAVDSVLFVVLGEGVEPITTRLTDMVGFDPEDTSQGRDRDVPLLHEPSDFPSNVFA
jgi:hypothetical protein